MAQPLGNGAVDALYVPLPGAGRRGLMGTYRRTGELAFSASGG
ncbi:MAG TPA: hypothetical protein VFN74_19575 [Chloroflexota bacterium]|jgi:hypothetical protein|nr:hypothetical protein [Chloroflexota bacterium]